MTRIKDLPTFETLDSENWVAVDTNSEETESGKASVEVLSSYLSANLPFVQSVNQSTGISVNNSDPNNPLVGLSQSSQDALNLATTAVQPHILGGLAYQDQITVPDIDATGTPNSSSALFGDGVWRTIPGGGNMLSSIYDPQNISNDAFDLANHTGEVPPSSVNELGLTRRLSARVGGLFDTVADLLADTTLTYSNVSPGDIIEAQGFRYEVAASGASDEHLTTAGGVKLYVLAINGKMLVQAFGNAMDKAQIDAAVSASEGLTLDFGDGFSYTSDGPILVGDGNSRANPLAIVGKSTITLTYEQDSAASGFGNPEKRQSGIHCWADPENDRTIDISGLTLEYTGTFDEGTNNGRVNGLFVYGYQGGRISKIRASGFNACGAYIGGSGAKSGGGNYDTIDTANITVRDCDFSGNRVAGVETGNTDNVRVLETDMHRNGKSGDTGTGYGFAAQSGTENTLLTVARCSANENFRKGIDTHAAEDFQIVGNTCRGNLLWGIFASTRSRGSGLISGNIITGMTATVATGLPAYGIYVGQDTSTTKALRATISDNYVEGEQEAGENFYPYVSRGGGENYLIFNDNKCRCGQITHFLLADNVGSTAETSLYINGSGFEADEVTSYLIRCYEENLVDLEFTNNKLVMGTGTYFFTEFISFDAGTAPAAASTAMRKITGNQVIANAGGVTKFFAGEATEKDNFINGTKFIPEPTYTVSGGVLTIGDVEYVRILAEGGAATDDLNTIEGLYNGQRVIFAASSSSQTIVFKDGTGNLALAGDFSLTHATDEIELRYRAGGDVWTEVSRSDNAA